jgi:nascent polypeptide-associated complex subunit alpha
MNPRDLQRMMKGMNMENIDAEEVIIRTKDKDLVISNPQVVKANMMGQESIQVIGKIHEVARNKIKDEDIELIVKQTGASPEKAKKALEETNDIAEAILKLSK